MKRIIDEKQLADFKKSLYEDEKSNATVEKYWRDLHRFAGFANNKVVDKRLVLEYKAMLGRTYALASANSMIAALNAFFRFAGWEECCIKQYKIQKKAFCTEEKELSKREYLALVRTAERQKKERLSLLLQTICGTGIRVSEVAFITVEAVRNGETSVSCKGKTRQIFIVSALRKKLLRYIKKHNIKSGEVFITKRGNTMDRSNIWAEMKKLCKEAGVLQDKVFPHNLRHLFARTFYRIEKDIAKLADILGHSNINTTRIYIVSTGAEHRRKMENMHLVI